MDIEVELTSRAGEALSSFKSAKERALEIIGVAGERYAKALAPTDTGNLRNSISHAYDADAAYIGTNVEYAPYQELGYTHVGGKFIPAANGGIGYLRPAVADHISEYKNMVETEMKKG